MQEYKLQAVAKSGNRKTGPIPVTYRSEDTCPTTCPFLPSGAIGGCYTTGRIMAQAERHGKGYTAHSLAKVFVAAEAGARYARDRVSGDIVENGAVDTGYLAMVAEAAALASDIRESFGDSRITPFGYTHAQDMLTEDDVAQVKATGYTLNASCETEGDVVRALALGMPAVIATDEVSHGDTLAGRRVVQCPATSRDDVTCASCGLCAKDYENRPVILFPIHGVARNKARRAVAERLAGE
jgi:hypothetical protein